MVGALVGQLLERGDLTEWRLMIEAVGADPRGRTARKLEELGRPAGARVARLGTSASRMSSYVNGGVVPSAALMVRARRVGGVGNEGRG